MGAPRSANSVGGVPLLAHSTGSAGVGAGGLDRGPARFEPRDRYAERRAGHVVEPDLVEEVDRVRIAAVLAADADLEVRPRGPALLDRDPDEPADAVPVNRLERGDPEDTQVQVAGEEGALHVVAREAPAHL